MESRNPDTKTMIFNTALRMFAQRGYENVSIRAIAEAVGIKTASIYYHYANKEEILDACYGFYTDHRHDTRLNKEEYRPILQSGTKAEVMAVLNYSFPEEIMENMILSLFIVFAHMYTDSKAQGIFADDISNSQAYLHEFFHEGIALGRFEPFNVNAISLIMLSARVFSAQSTALIPDKQKEWNIEITNVFDEVVGLIPFKY